MAGSWPLKRSTDARGPAKLGADPKEVKAGTRADVAHPREQGSTSDGQAKRGPSHDEGHSASKSKEVPTPAATWVGPEDI